MGQFRIEITAVGGHGCSRNIGDGEKVYGCRQMNCPDCLARQFVQHLKLEGGCNVESALLIHWPGQPAEVVDNLETRVRKGAFPK